MAAARASALALPPQGIRSIDDIAILNNSQKSRKKKSASGKKKSLVLPSTSS